MSLMKGKVAIFNHKGKRFVNIDDLVSEIEVPEGTKGEKGDKGDQGEKGEQGIQGVQGVKGDKGDQGEQGVAGEKGEQGIQGVQGIQGIKGDTGNGFSLAKVYPSVDAMNADFSNPDIEIHSFVLINSDDLDNGKLYVKNETEYSFQSQLSGVKGDKGDTGAQGVQGVAGAQGERGIQGLQGIQGVQGERGIQGIQGVQGAKGDKGDKGDAGEDAPLKGYLYGKRGSPQTITKAGDVVLFDTSFLSRDISYNASNGQFVLLADKVYRITFTTGIAFTSTNGFVSFALTDNTGTQLEQTTGLFSNIASAHNGAGNYLLDIVYRPTVDTDCTISVHEITANASYLIRSGYTSLVVQEL